MKEFILRVLISITLVIVFVVLATFGAIALIVVLGIGLTAVYLCAIPFIFLFVGSRKVRSYIENYTNPEAETIQVNKYHEQSNGR